jgi:hypothetical protein
MATFTAGVPDSRCEEMRKLGLENQPFRLLSGGWNQGSEYLRFKFGAGDRLLAVAIERGIVYVIGAMTVVAKALRAQWCADHPEDARVITGSQVVVGEAGIPIRFDRGLPPALLERLAFQSGKVTRPLKHVKDGVLKNASTFQGVFRLSPESEAEVNALLEHGLVSPGEVGALERRLAVAPADAGLLQVYADALLDRGDPRGEVLQLERAFANDPAAKELDRGLTKLLERHFHALVGRPGGWPFRIAWAPVKRIAKPKP